MKGQWLTHRAMVRPVKSATYLFMYLFIYLFIYGWYIDDNNSFDYIEKNFKLASE